MAKSLNQVTLLGRLTRDPELRQTPNGASVASFSMALNRSYKDSAGEWQEQTDFIDCVAWGPLAERLEKMVKRGQRLLVNGRLSQRSWEQDGQKRSKVEVVINDMTLIEQAGDQGDSSFGGGSDEGVQTSPSNDVVVEDVSDEEIDLDSIPF
ncbi:MAG: single-stranded DNA-binding protein [Candidatus Nomurabacteria bacterium]|nr:MAG: single-stranded DNA-binding protein [Candidatus Nomurabacteria bacterium]HRV76237.1 single-stranded DNA-binding protein [Candidatus Saccharimonadales bacterium]